MRDKIRQGDLLFVRTHAGSHREVGEIGLRKDGIIREGEATGHHHMLKDPTSARVFRPRFGDPIVVVGNKAATVVHPEHKPVKLKAQTTYRVHVAREFDIAQKQARYVAD